MIGLDEALRLLATLPRPDRREETVPIAQGAGRILAAPAIARWPLPRFSCAALDGWAFRAADLPPGLPRLPVVGRIAAGEDATGRSVTGCAIRIFTGAMVPADADTIVKQEDASVSDGVVALPDAIRAGQNVRRQGEQAEAGAVLIPAGRRLRPQDLAAAAAGGLTTFDVVAPLQVGILSTGDEVRPIGAVMEPGTIPDQNGAMLAAMLIRWGATPLSFGLVSDDPVALTERLRAMSSSCDLILTTGGVSVGEEDHLRAAIEAVGRLLFWRLALKPGRPTALGLAGRTPVLGLPGNPAAAFTAFHLLGEPLVRHLSAETSWVRRTSVALAAFAHSKGSALAEALPVTLRAGGGAMWAEKAGADRGGLAALAKADGLALLDREREAVTVGDSLAVIEFGT